MRPRRGNPQSFDHLPEVYDRFGQLTGSRLLDHLARRLPPRGGRAVDLGCGTGRHAGLLADRYEEVLAVDVSAPMLRFAQTHRARPNVNYQQRSLEAVRSDRDGAFDLVFSAYTLHHVPVSDLDATLTQIRSLVRPGGQAILVDMTDSRRQVPRAWFRRQAALALARDLQRRRGLGDAVWQLRVSLSPAWLDHVTTDQVLSRAEFARRYQRAFPGGTITTLDPAQTLRQAQVLEYVAPPG